MKYEYKCISFKAQVTQADIEDGKAGSKVSGQLESLFEDYTKDGWELQGQYSFQVEVKNGCIESLKGNSHYYVPIDQLVFRRSL